MSWLKEAGGFLRKAIQERIAAAFASLLESKHLYQSVTVDIETDLVESRKLPVMYLPPELPAEVTPPAPSREQVERGAQDMFAMEWDVDGAESGRTPRHSIMDGHPRVLLPPIKTGCSRCKSAEAFQAVRCDDLCLKSYPAAPARPATPAAYQLFACTYQCQRCAGPHEAFLVRRMGPKLTLCGRAPIAYTDVPGHIPGSVREHFKNAAVAAQTGQVLAALFLLRTVIEQVARIETKLDVRPADKILDAYMDRLPEDFKRRFPSLRSLYDELSVAMHEAREDDELFSRSFAAVSRHFEARRVFGL